MLGYCWLVRAPLICSNWCIVVAVCPPKLSWSRENSAIVLCIVSLIPILLHTPQKVTALFILSLLWSGKRGMFHCAVEDLVFGNKPFSLWAWSEAFCTYPRCKRAKGMGFGSYEKHGSDVNPWPHIHSFSLCCTTFKTSCSRVLEIAGLSVTRLQNMLALSGNSRSVCPLGGEFSVNL